MPKKKLEKEVQPIKKENKKDNQLYWVLGAMGVLIVIFFAANSIFQSLNKFEYQGLTFVKTKFGEIPLYYYYYYTNPSHTTGAVTGAPVMINVYLRTDPRKNNVSMDGEVDLLQGKFVYVSLNSTNLQECAYSSLALANFASFLNQNGFTVKAGVLDESEAKQESLEYVTCEQHPDNPVILIKSGDKTEIKRDSKIVYTAQEGKLLGKSTEYTNCYTITVANCEILPATEKFIVQSIIDAKTRA